MVVQHVHLCLMKYCSSLCMQESAVCPVVVIRWHYHLYALRSVCRLRRHYDLYVG